MIASARVETPDAAGLAVRMANHFGHKVPVERSEGEVRIELPTAVARISVQADALALRVEADEEAGLARGEQVVASHLERFVRGAPVTVSWSRA